METNVKQIKMFYHIDKNSTLENYNQVIFCIMLCKAILCQWVFCFLSLFLAICHGEVLWSEGVIEGSHQVSYGGQRCI